jgi:hypothetical protein
MQADTTIVTRASSGAYNMPFQTETTAGSSQAQDEGQQRHPPLARIAFDKLRDGTFSYPLNVYIYNGGKGESPPIPLVKLRCRGEWDIRNIAIPSVVDRQPPV